VAPAAAAPGRKPSPLGRAHGELGGTVAEVGRAASPGAAVPVRATGDPGLLAEPLAVGPLGAAVGRPAAAPVDPAATAPATTAPPATAAAAVPVGSGFFAAVVVPAPEAVCSAADFFRPSRSSKPTFFGAAPVGDAAGALGAGPGWGEGTGVAEAADPGAELADVAEPCAADGPDAADGGGPGGGAAEEADRAEYAEPAE